MKQFEKQKEEFNGILYVSVRTKIPSSDKVMPHDQTHWLKTLIFTPLRFNKAVASDQHNSHRTTGCFDDRLLTMMTDTGFYVQ